MVINGQLCPGMQDRQQRLKFPQDRPEIGIPRLNPGFLQRAFETTERCNFGLIAARAGLGFGADLGQGGEAFFDALFCQR